MVLALAAMASVATPVSGSPAPVTMESAMHEVLSWHPSVVQAAATLDARGEDVTIARAGYLPRISAGVGSGYDSRLGSIWRPRPQLSASQMLYDFGKVASAVDYARAGTRLGRADMLLAIDGLIRDTGYAMVEVQRNAALRTIALEQLSRIEEISALVEKRFGKGATTRSDALQAQSRVAAAQATLTRIEAEQRRWTTSLAFLLGRDIAPVVDPDVPDWLMRSCTQATQVDWADIPVIMRAKAQYEQATAEQRRARANRLPTIALAGDAAADISSPFSDRSVYNFGLNVSSDVFGGSAVRARVRGADYALRAAEAAERQARVEIGQRLAEAQQQITGLTELLGTLSERQDNMVETGKLYRLQYLDMGTRTLVDLLNAEQELQQARFDGVNTTHDLRRLAIDCLYYSGRARDDFKLTGTTVRGVTL
ncbi:outer membrane efflux family protein [Sphingomonas sp. S17]|jgi:adhesin transport system outer membrane protein|uniref:DNA, contig: SP607 n=2 Tax=Sphingomonas paucimobilis TaxID=13689 RepID=A0A0C9LZV6_SPHPI|nr:MULTISPECIES: TolC family protein [Sphingomonas]EGI54397.1 outer membrane efflux family protein [Sphingomonas sp. S17]MCM3677940.1 TolC family protein [Sphingomonas paucimobilis]MDG5972569.1 TolC family protein [Sphingomonas paucimobilis]SUJ24296.1 outer membrane channel protein [Sphingomonas paucimobilis]GAN12385.1 putative type I secretion system outer membrane protein [Sphingomonas paucimobilis NBRC 13935]